MVELAAATKVAAASTELQDWCELQQDGGRRWEFGPMAVAALSQPHADRPNVTPGTRNPNFILYLKAHSFSFYT